MKDRLEGKAIIAVGSANGIGAVTVRRLAAEGAKVCAADINLAGAQAVAASVGAAGGTAFAVHVDIADEASGKAAVDAAIAGLGRLDGAHINAADLRVIMQDSDALEEDLAIFDRTLSVNLRGHLLCTRLSRRICWQQAAARSSTPVPVRRTERSPPGPRTPLPNPDSMR
jgi:NAD(P)-dependent dehydrogenase (short-subunit alcohol dehydrogenase family)